MINEDYILTNEEIEKSWWGSWGENPNKREIITDCLLKTAADYANGYTIREICMDMALLETKRGQIVLTHRGKRVMYHMNKERLNDR